LQEAREKEERLKKQGAKALQEAREEEERLKEREA
jgi:hypothetical protein